MTPVNTDALEGDLVRLPLVTPEEPMLMRNGGTLPWFAEGYPRQDDLDAAGMVGQDATNDDGENLYTRA